MATSALYFNALILTIIALSIPYCMAQEYIIYPGGSLNSGGYLRNNDYKFIMQDDCNLVLYDFGRAIWSSKTNGKGSNCRCTMQRDGNLVVYAGNGNAVWASNTNREEGNYVLVLQHDRNVVIYGGSLWATGTNLYGNGVTIEPYVPKNATIGPIVVNEIKTNGEKIAMVTKK